MLTVSNNTDVQSDSTEEESYFYDLLHFEFFGIYLESIYGYAAFVSKVNNKNMHCTASIIIRESSQLHDHLFIHSVYVCIFTS